MFDKPLVHGDTPTATGTVEGLLLESKEDGDRDKDNSLQSLSKDDEEDLNSEVINSHDEEPLVGRYVTSQVTFHSRRHRRMIPNPRP